MISAFYNKKNLNDSLIIRINNNSVMKIEKQEKYSLLFDSNNSVVGINIFNFSKYKTISEGFIFIDDSLIEIISEITNIDLQPYKENNFVIGKVTKKEHIPNTHLNYCDVEINNKALKIVCGANNVEINKFVVVAMIGTFMPNGMYIESGKIKGYDSFGMLCSCKELNISNDMYNESGIISMNNGNIGELFRDAFVK